MKRIIARCGLYCDECGAYKATLADDDALRVQVSQEWSKMYGADIKTENINCLSCQNDEVLFHHCTVCEMRKCAVERNLANCGLCSDYPCEIITKFFEFVPECKTVLDQIHSKR